MWLAFLGRVKMNDSGSVQDCSSLLCVDMKRQSWFGEMVSRGALSG